MSQLPRVSIGLPVYNGEDYLDPAIRAILDQDLSDFELIITDNASTDSTREICMGFADRDSRVRYHKHESNIGVASNFNFTVSLATAPYFLWAAADDYYAPSYIRKCIEVLDADPDVVLCSSLVCVIDPDDNEVAVYDSEVDGAANSSPVGRLRALIMHRHLCTDMFGVMRTETMRRSELLNEYYGSDRGFLAEMALLGRFTKVREPLFNNREHPGRGSRLGIEKQVKAGQRMPIWKLFRHYRRAVHRHVVDSEERRSCRRLLHRWWFVDWNLARLGVDAIGSMWSSIYRIVNSAKVRIYGPVPQIDRKR